MSKRIAIIVGALILGGLVLPLFRSARLLERAEIVETLNHPVAVDTWNDVGVVLASGRVLPLPDLTKLPKESEVLANTIQSGIEITNDGRVFGLVRVNHWCGNDPVRKHLARVDLSHMLMYMREVDLSHDDDDLAESRHPPVGTAFSENGWNISCYYGFVSWSKLASTKGL